MRRIFFALAMAVILPMSLMADSTHVVSQSDLQNQVVTASQARQQNIQKIEKFLSTDTAQQAMQSAHMDAEQVKNAVPSLNDQELAHMAQRADKAQSAFAAGHLGTRDLAIVVLGIVIVILIIVVSH
ncbi:MAG TPA: PA2779 family protein [Terriglobales bacterium]|jgi:t-SNARE complex subunit (syntaxin)